MNNIKNSFKLQILFNIKNYNVWLFSGIHDLKKKYRKTLLGPFWNVISNIILMFVITAVWTQVFNISVKEFVPHVFTGLVIWFFLTDVTVGSTTIITEKWHSYFQNVFIPVLSICLRYLTTNIFVFFHNLPIFLILMFYLSTLQNILFVFLGLIILLLNSIWLTILMVFLGTRFRDIKPLASSIMAAGTLITPIMWKKDMLGKYENYVYFNPFTHIIEVVRAPLIGNNVELFVYLTNIFFIIIGFSLTYFLFKKKGSKLIYWV